VSGARAWDLTRQLTPYDAVARRDRATQLALTLAQELWVVKDRLQVLEAVLSAEGRDLRDLVDRFQPDAALRAALDAERQRFIAAVLAALDPPGDRPLDPPGDPARDSAGDRPADLPARRPGRRR
jgi:hypothetical protein